MGWVLCATIAVCGGCAGFYESAQSQTPVSVRIENGTSSMVEVTLTVSREEAPAATAPATAGNDNAAGDGSTSAGDTPAQQPLPTDTGIDADSNGTDAATNGASATTPNVVTIGLRHRSRRATAARSSSGLLTMAQTTVADDAVRVGPVAYSDGVVPCGDEIVVSARVVNGTAATILLTGAGTGTIGFDEESVGAEGERILLNPAHFGCGATVVVRVTDDGATAGSGTSGSGEVAVYPRGDTPPDPDFEVPATGDSEPSNVEIRIANSTNSFTQLHVIVGQPAGPITAVAAEGEESDGGFDVRVPPGFLSTGVVACESQIILVGSIVVPGLGIDEPDTFTQVVITGLGTGTPNFDENSVGAQAQQRILLRDAHFSCGDVIQVEFTSDGDPGSASQTIGQAIVTLVP
jgi:hypothetical protein